MDLARLTELFLDQQTVEGRAITALVILVIAVVGSRLLARLVARRRDTPIEKYHTRKVVRGVTLTVVILILAVYLRPFGGQIGALLGLATAGVAFAMQEVIGAIAGWFNIFSGRIFKVGDRIEMGGVRGDVIDVTLLRTKLMEIGSDDGTSWVKGRQYTGRVVAVSNKATFTDPVYNSSAEFEYLWEELTIPIPHHADWEEAERILDEEARRISSTSGASDAIRTMVRRYPVPRLEVEPRVFTLATDNYMQLSARFVVPLRTARSTKHELTHRIEERFAEAGIEIASTTMDVTVHGEEGV